MNQELRFQRGDDFHAWLEENHDTSNGIWLVFEKGKDTATITAQEALEEALCFGWIDGKLQRIDDSIYKKKFTPRRKKSNWSERNKNLAERLIREGLMADAGKLAIECAKKNGTWDVGREKVNYDELTALLEAALRPKDTAYDNYLKMSPSVRRTYAAYYADAKKEETRKRRLEKIADRVERNLPPM
jgi:uncharacterized protein YdeI (YjbR/CyaY-like superfamily)